MIDAKFKEVLAIERARAVFTPDQNEIDKRPYHRVLVYDRMKRNFPDQNKLDAIAFLGEAYTTDTRFILWKHNLGYDTYPVATEKNRTGFSHNIRGELYLLTTESLMGLDKSLGNGVRWSRIEVDLIHPYKIVQEKPSYVESDWIENYPTAWMYVGLENHWKSPIMTDNRITTCGEYRTSRDRDLMFYEFLLKDIDL